MKHFLPILITILLFGCEKEAFFSNEKIAPSTQIYAPPVQAPPPLAGDSVRIKIYPLNTCYTTCNQFNDGFMLIQDSTISMPDSNLYLFESYHSYISAPMFYDTTFQFNTRYKIHFDYQRSACSCDSSVIEIYFNNSLHYSDTSSVWSYTVVGF